LRTIKSTYTAMSETPQTKEEAGAVLGGSPCSAVALPITARAKEYHAWRDRLASDPTCWKFSEREDAIAFAAFIAGWWLRTGDNPDEFFNPPNAIVQTPPDSGTRNHG
jgi:hypothetical protein